MDKKSTAQLSLLRRPLTWLILPLVLFAGAIAWTGLHELRANQRVNKIKEGLRTQGVLVDNVTLESHFLASTSTDGTHAWSEIGSLFWDSSWSASSEGLPYVSWNDKPPANLVPGGPWEKRERVAEYLEIVHPIVEKIHEIAEYPTPVWQPIHFQGFKTSLGVLEKPYCILSVLQLDAEYAIYENDAERAIADLQAMADTADAYDWDFFFGVKLWNIAAHAQRRAMIRRSLYADAWTAEQIVRVRALIGPQEQIKSEWPKIVESERALVLVSMSIPETRTSDSRIIAGLLSHVSEIPSVTEGYLEHVASACKLADEGFDGLRGRAQALDKEAEDRKEDWVLGVYRGILDRFAWLATAFIEQEDTRRFTLTSVGVKQFQLQHDRWPASLSELESVGLNSQDWNTIGNGRFGYEVEGDRVFVWTYQAGARNRVSDQRPTIPPSNYADERFSFIITIR